MNEVCFRERQVSYDIASMWIVRKKKSTSKFIYKQKQSYRCRKQAQTYQGRRRGGRIKWAIGVDKHTVYKTGNYIHKTDN